MKAVIWKGNNDFQAGQVEIPKPAKGQLLIKVKASAICTTDLHYADFKCIPPIIPGHEVSGIVAQVTNPNSTFKTGDRVILDPVQRCGHCQPCKTGIDHLCLNTRHLGDTDIPGGWAQYVCIDEANAYKLPGNVSFDAGAISEPIAVCMESFKRADFKAGTNVLIMGDGVFGYIQAMLAEVYGASKIIVAGHYDEKLKRIKQTTNAITCNTHNQNLNDILEKNSIDLAIEATGAGPCPNIAINFLKPRATLMLFSYIWKPQTLNIAEVHMKELNILGSCRSLNCFAETVELMAAGKIKPEKLIDLKLPLTEIEQAMTSIKEDKKNIFKAVLIP